MKRREEATYALLDMANLICLSLDQLFQWPMTRKRGDLLVRQMKDGDGGEESHYVRLGQVVLEVFRLQKVVCRT